MDAAEGTQFSNSGAERLGSARHGAARREAVCCASLAVIFITVVFSPFALLKSALLILTHALYFHLFTPLSHSLQVERSERVAAWCLVASWVQTTVLSLAGRAPRCHHPYSTGSTRTEALHTLR